MTPPRPSDMGPSPEAEPPAAVLSCATMETLRQRADFLRAAQARKAGTGGFLLQARDRHDDHPPRVGFTASKKIGNAVFRNRAKRRLRALAHELLSPVARQGWDYVLVAKPNATVSRDFAVLKEDLRTAILAVHKERS